MIPLNPCRHIIDLFLEVKVSSGIEKYGCKLINWPVRRKLIPYITYLLPTENAGKCPFILYQNIIYMYSPMKKEHEITLKEHVHHQNGVPETSGFQNV